MYRIGGIEYSGNDEIEGGWDMPRASLDLQNSDDLNAVSGEWRFAVGLVPGEPNEGLVALSEGSPARLSDYDDSGWEVCGDLAEWRSHGLSFIWYRIEITIPETIGGRDVRGTNCLFGNLHRRLRRGVGRW